MCVVFIFILYIFLFVSVLPIVTSRFETCLIDNVDSPQCTDQVGPYMETIVQQLSMGMNISLDIENCTGNCQFVFGFMYSKTSDIHTITNIDIF